MGDPFTFDRRPDEDASDARTTAAPDPDVTFYQPRALQPGEIIGHYRIEAPLGQGGNGAAYAARNIDDEDERVAIKLIRPDRRDRVRLARLLRAEAAALRRVKHDAIVQYRTFKRIPDSDEYYLVTEHIDGPTLSVCLNERPFAPAEICRLAVRVAHALESAHAQGVIHRDLSPDNIILPGGDPARATLIDFGIAKQGTVDPLGVDFVGKLAYAAPEQFEGDPTRIGPWTDLYSLGLVLAAASRGRRLDMGRDMESAIAARQGEPGLDDIPETLRRPIAALLKSDPEARIRSAGAAAALFGRDETVYAATGQAIAPSLARRVPKPPRSFLVKTLRFAIGAVFASIAAFLLAATTYGIWEAIRTWNDPPESEIVAGGDGGSSVAPAKPAAPTSSTTLNPEVAEAAAKGRAAAALGRLSEGQARIADAVADLFSRRAAATAADADFAATRGRVVAEYACRGGTDGFACRNHPDGTREAGEQKCSGAACVWSGFVEFSAPDGTSFQGQMEYGRYKLGVLVNLDGSVYAGAFEGGQPTGLGRLTERDGVVLTGQFKNGALTGFGNMAFQKDDGTGRLSYRGTFDQGLRNGPGIDRSTDGSQTAGDYQLGQLTGFGVERRPQGRIEAKFQDWFTLEGVAYYPDGRRYEGGYGARVEGDLKLEARAGLGVLYAPDGSIEFQGSWSDDKPVEAMK